MVTTTDHDDQGRTTMTTTYRHAPDHYRATAEDMAEHLAAIADHLDRIGTPDPVLAARLDELTDAVLAAEAEAIAVRLDLDEEPSA